MWCVVCCDGCCGVWVGSGRVCCVVGQCGLLWTVVQGALCSVVPCGV